MDARADLVFGFKVSEELEGYDQIVELFEDGENEEINSFLVSITNHESSTLYVYMGEHIQGSWEEDTVIETINTPGKSEKVAAMELCEKYNIPWEKPKWNLIASYW